MLLMLRLSKIARAPAVGALMLSIASSPVWAGATSSASISNQLSGCGASTLSSAGSGSDTSMAAIVDSSVGGCSMRASGFSFLGVVGASAQSSLTGGFGSSGAIFSKASGSWTDTIQPEVSNLNMRVSVDIDRIMLTYSIGATGGVSANRSDTPDGRGGVTRLANGTAKIGYDFNVGGQAFAGEKSFNGFDGSSTETGQWGTVSGTIFLDVLVDLGGDIVSFSSVGVSMNGRADADVGNAFVGGQRSAFGSADFGSTLIWNGISSAVGLDASGNVVQLPQDFRLNLRGQSGLDYWSAARRPGDNTVPAPQTAWLVLLGLASAAGIRRADRRVTVH